MILTFLRGKGIARGEGLTEGLRLLFYVLLPLTAYALFAMSAVAWALGAPFANAITAFAVVILLLSHRAQQLDDHAWQSPGANNSKVKEVWQPDQAATPP